MIRILKSRQPKESEIPFVALSSVAVNCRKMLEYSLQAAAGKRPSGLKVIIVAVPLRVTKADTLCFAASLIRRVTATLLEGHKRYHRKAL